MKIMADENLESAIVFWLRSIGHDVVWQAETPELLPDEMVLRQANEESRIIMTSDLDFGELIFRQRRSSQGIVLFRIKSTHQSQKLEIIQSQWPTIENRLVGNFVVVTNQKIRIRPLYH